MPAAGKIGNLRAVVPTVPGGSASWAVTIDKNEATTTLTCTITAAITTCQDTNGAHDITIAAGDRVAVRVVPASTPASANMRVSALWQPTTADQTIWPLGTGSLNTTAVNATPFFLGANATESFTIRQVVPVAGTFKNLYTWCNATASSSTRVFTILKTGVATAITCTQTGTANTCNDTSNTASVVAGDQIDMSYTATGTPGAQGCGAGVVFVPTTSGLYVMGGLVTTASTPTTATNVFGAISAGGPIALVTTEDALVQQLAQASTVKNIYVLLNAGNGSGSTTTMTLNKNAGNTAETCSITNGTTCNLTTDATVADDDLLDTVFSHTGSAGTARNANVGYSAHFTGTFP